MVIFTQFWVCNYSIPLELARMSVDKHEIKAFHNSTTTPRQAYFRQTDSAHGTGQSAAIGQNNGISQSAGIGSNGKITESARPDVNRFDATRSDVKRWLVAGSQSPTLLRDNLDQLVVEPGDSYWSLAKLVVSIRTGRVATSAEVKEMVKEMAHFNGKTQCEATKIMVGDVIKVPPEKPKA